MNQRPHDLKNILLFLLLTILFSGRAAFAQQPLPDLNIGTSPYTVEVNTKREFQNVNLTKNSSVLTVNGTLIVHGNLDMLGNGSQFNMGENAKVIVYGDFLSSNMVSITAKSYLIIYGSFINKTPNNNADLNVSGGNIYIFGTVSNWGDQFTTCEDYAGDTGEIVNEPCDYGTGDDFDDNVDEFPPELKELIPCASTHRWTGSVSSNWLETQNWSCGKVPTLTTAVVIPAGVTQPILGAGITGQVKNITIQEGASLMINGGELQVAGAISAISKINATSGKVKFLGTAAQQIPQGAFVNNNIKDLEIENTAGVTLLGSLNILNALKVTTGTFQTGANLTLISNASGTAYIDGSGTGVISGKMTMQRYLSNGFGYKYFSSPFSGTTVADFSPFMEFSHSTTQFPHFYEYVEGRQDIEGNDLTGWKAFTAPTGALVPGKGYALNLSEATTPVTVELTGLPTQGNVNLQLQSTAGTYTKGFHLVGNPYPSPIDWTAVNRTGVDNAIYFFTAGTANRYTGTYTAFVNGISTDGRSSKIIPSMQGFFVKVSDPSVTGSLTFTNAARRGSELQQEFYKGKKAQNPLLKLALRFNDEILDDATIIYFTPEGTRAFEHHLDAKKILNTAVEVPSLYSITTATEKLAINAVSASTEELLEIPLGFKAERSGNMTITLSEVKDVFPTPYIYLQDLKSNKVKELFPGTEYAFSAQKGEINDRFILLLSPDKLSVKDLENRNQSFAVYTEGGQIVVSLSPSASGTTGRLILNDLSGRILQVKEIPGDEEIRFNKLLTSGIYMVTLESQGKRETKKIAFNK